MKLKMRNWILSILMVLFIVLQGSNFHLYAAVGDAFTVNKITYQITDDTVKTVRIKSSTATGAITVPEKVSNQTTEYTVTAIADSAFENSKITGIVLPKTLTTIGMSAFSDCGSLTSITVPEDVKRIEEGAFAFAGIESITLPNSLEFIGNNAFTATPLIDIVIPDNVSEIEAYAFSSCASLKNVVLPDELESISNNLFENTSNLESIHLPENLKSIGESAFFETGLKTVYIPDGVTTIGEYAFTQSDLETVSLPGSILDPKDNCFSYTKMSNVTFREGYTKIGSTMFVGCQELTSINLPDTLKEIGSHAFSETGLTSITIPESVETIGSNVFSYCYKLNTANLPESLVNIPEAMFYASGLSEVNFSTQLESIDKEAFFGTGIGNLIIPKTVTTIGTRAFESCDTKGGKVLVLSRQLSAELNALAFSSDTTIYMPKLKDMSKTENSGADGCILKLYDLDHIEVITEPKVAYTVGETFDPTGLEIEWDYYAEGENNPLLEGETTTYTEDTKADFTFDKTVLDTDDTAIEATYLEKPFTINIMVTKQTPNVVIPEGLQTYEGKTLASMTLPEGFEWKDKTIVVEHDGEYEATYTPKDTNTYEVVEVSIPVKAIRYTLTSDKEIWEDETITFTSNGQYKDFKGIQIDGKEVNESNYETKQGSTIVILKEAYRKEVGKGEHQFTMMFEGKEISKTFTVSVKENKPEEPDTPDVPDTPDTPDVPDTPDTPDIPDVPKQPEQPSKPVNPIKPIEPDKPKKPTNTEKDKAKTPDTYDHTIIGLYMSGILLGGYMLITLCKKRKDVK